MCFVNLKYTLCICEDILPSSVSCLSVYHQIDVQSCVLCERPVCVSSNRCTVLSSLWEFCLCIIKLMYSLMFSVRDLSMYHQIDVQSYVLCERPVYVSSNWCTVLCSLLEFCLCIIKLMYSLVFSVRVLSMYHQIDVQSYVLCERPVYVSSNWCTVLCSLWETCLCIIKLMYSLVFSVRVLSMYHQIDVQSCVLCESSVYVSSNWCTVLCSLWEFCLCIIKLIYSLVFSVRVLSMYHQIDVQSCVLCKSSVYVSSNWCTVLCSLWEFCLCIIKLMYSLVFSVRCLSM